jgi:hypothetical protein
MSPSLAGYGWFDDLALTVGLGLILLGLVVMGVFATLLGSAHFSEFVPGIGVVIIHTSFSTDLRAALIAFGLLVLLLWSVSRTLRTIFR